jgi:hypothetical protein
MIMVKTSGIPGTRQKFPIHFALRLLRLAKPPLPATLDSIRQQAAAIGNGDYRPVFKLMEKVVANDFRPEICQAAAEVLALIARPADDIDLPLGRFGFQQGRPSAFLLGAFYELLPRPLAQKIFLRQFQPGFAFVTDTKRTSGEALLCFSGAKRAAEFIQSLCDAKLMTGDQFLAVLSCTSDYRFRRYDLAALVSQSDHLQA